MASMLRNLADKLEGKDKQPGNTHTSNTAPHHSAAANTVDPRIDSSNTHNVHTHGNPGLIGSQTQSTTTGAHNSDLANRLDPRVDSTQTGGYGTSHTTSHHTGGTGGYGSTTTATHQSTTVGPHSSNLANKLDPRVDSDLDGRNNPTSHVGGHGNTHATTGTGYGHTTTGSGYTGTNTSTNVGPHSSNLMNKLDPRVDSDLDGNRNPTSHVGGHGNTHTMGTTHGTTHSTTGHVGGNTHSTTTGPHSSGLMNKLDPRVDTVDSSRNPTSHVGGYGNTHTTGANYDNAHTTTGHVGGNTHSTNTGPHSSGLMNKLDPRVDSNTGGYTDQISGVGGYGSGATHQQSLDTQHNTGYTSTNTNPTHNDPRSTNTGPHSSNLLNKLDPRVDSDRDGRNDPTSRIGGHGNTQTGPDRVGRY